MGLNVGLDIGTSTCVVSWYDAAGPKGALPYAHLQVEGGSGPMIPSYVWLSETLAPMGHGPRARDRWYLGDPREGSDRCYRRFKMDIGLRKVFRDDRVTPEDLTRMMADYLLSEMKKKAPGFDPGRDEAVVTVPHGWVRDHPERRAATRAAVEKAGWKVRTLVSEPVAAAAYYAFERTRGGNETPRSEVYLVCDMGGGTFDLSLVELKNARHLLVIDAECNDFAGDLADALIAQDLLALDGRGDGASQLGLSGDPVADAQRLLGRINESLELREFMGVAEKYKIDLNATSERNTKRGETDKEIWSDAGRFPPMQFARMHELLQPLIDRSWALVRQFIERNAAHRPSRVVLVGGMSALAPLKYGLRAKAVEWLGKDNVRVEVPVEGQGALSIARGAGLIAAGQMTFQEVLMHPVGIMAQPSSRQVAAGVFRRDEIVNRVMLPRGHTFPCTTRSGEKNIRYLVQPGQTTVEFRVSFDDKDRLLESDPARLHYWAVDLWPPPTAQMLLDLRLDITDAGELKISALGRDGESLSTFNGRILR